MKIALAFFILSGSALASCIGEAQMFPTKVKSVEKLESGCKVFVTSLNLNFNPICPLDDTKAWYEGIRMKRCPSEGDTISGILVDDGEAVYLY